MMHTQSDAPALLFDNNYTLIDAFLSIMPFQDNSVPERGVTLSAPEDSLFNWRDDNTDLCHTTMSRMQTLHIDTAQSILW